MQRKPGATRRSDRLAHLHRSPPSSFIYFFFKHSQLARKQYLTLKVCKPTSGLGLSTANISDPVSVWLLMFLVLISCVSFFVVFQPKRELFHGERGGAFLTTREQLTRPAESAAPSQACRWLIESRTPHYRLLFLPSRRPR